MWAARALLCLWLCARASWGISLSAGPPSRQNAKPHLQFTSHHKTGSVLSEGLLSCVRGFENDPGRLPDCGMPMVYWHHWNGTIPDGCDKVVHFVRHPVDIVRSAYLYHRRTPPMGGATEPWEQQYLSETLGEERTRQLLSEHGLDELLGETVSEFLLRAPAEAGLQVVMLGIGGESVVEMKSSWRATRHDPRVHTICMADTWSGFDDMVRRMLRFIGSEEVAPGGDVAECFRRRDPQYLRDNDHITHNFVSHSEVQRLMDAIAVLDRDKFDGNFTKGGLAGWCGPDSQAGFAARGHAVDGGIDPRLLTDELA